MKKGKKLPRLIKTDLLKNECRRCFKEVIIEKFKGFHEGSNKWNGKTLLVGFCKNGCPDIFFAGLKEVNLEGDYYLVQVN